MTCVIKGAYVVVDRDIGDNFVVVSKVPAADFTKQSTLLIAGKVLGKTETKLPLLGATQVLHLQYVGGLFCKVQDCRGVLLPKKGK